MTVWFALLIERQRANDIRMQILVKFSNPSPHVKASSTITNNSSLVGLDEEQDFFLYNSVFLGYW